MSNVSYSLNHKGVRLIDAQDAWQRGKDGKFHRNSNYNYIGKIEMSMPNMVVSVSENRKPSYRCDVSELNRAVKREIVNHFYDENGKRNRKTVAYFGTEKKK